MFSEKINTTITTELKRNPSRIVCGSLIANWFVLLESAYILVLLRNGVWIYSHALYKSRIARDFIVSSTLTLTGEKSLQTVAITKVYDIGDNSALVDPTSSNSENVAFEVTADGFLDFTESNPFGDPSDNY